MPNFTCPLLSDNIALAVSTSIAFKICAPESYRRRGGEKDLSCGKIGSVSPEVP